MNIINRIGQYLQSGRAWNTRNVNTIKVFSVHHDAIPHGKSADDALNQIYSEHKQRGWPGASYHYYIHSDGQVYQINKHEWVTWIDGINYDAIGIVLNGYFHPDVNNKPTNAQLKSLKELLDELSTQHPEFPADQSGVYGHRERAQTACPGDFAFPYVKEYREKKGAVSWGTPAPTPQPNPNPGVINDQTKYDFGGDIGVQELGAVRSMINDLRRDLKSSDEQRAGLQKKLADAKNYMSNL